MSSVPALWTQNRQLARKIARGYYASSLELQDLEQEALVALWIAARNFDPTRGSFRPFASTVIHRRMAAIVKAANRHRATVLTDAVRDQELELVGGPDLERIVIARETLQELVARRDELLEHEATRARWRDAKRAQRARAA